MGMGYMACAVDIVKPEFVRAMVGERYGTLLSRIEDAGLDLDEFANNVYNDLYANEDIEKTVPIIEALRIYNEICEEFHKATGLPLNLGYHNTLEGSRYDDVDGYFWEVGGVWQITPTAAEYEQYIQRATYVVFG